MEREGIREDVPVGGRGLQGTAASQCVGSALCCLLSKLDLSSQLSFPHVTVRSY